MEEFSVLLASDPLEKTQVKACHSNRKKKTVKYNS